MVMSKRVTNARSATHYKRTGPLKQKETYSFWDDAGVLGNRIGTAPKIV
ncbi:hypothetical protein PSENEW3n2_00005111 [Picochlorum sp. SENEW3]|nr:hypothetical protein PSENEW3n2_00005107 [Picochlorum sp. SENEW3]WPT11611.1 hypothetical protein PSENEW3n2_00005111 [Picochlorum sp. SENEW3]WPT17100.1 hypothetical protein PSENEW3_00005107 [Picochlorum sp. SENEW3]WPT17106.1 hypothetical protein PSENEW3_00005111 [Picochlorum sp. SENEW3]